MDSAQHQIETPGEAGKFLFVIPAFCCVVFVSSLLFTSL